ncbi:MAG: hypothetical protein JRJ26_20315, partial [Deltaproteobacteria bacterium]|nr:hypothetical protein [Deltaproteobacteria bacterium]
ILAPALAGPALKVLHNAKFDIRVLRQAGMPLAPPYYDTMIAAFLLDENGEHGLKYLARDYLRRKATTYEEALGGEQTLADVPLEVARDYACADAENTLALKAVFQPLLERECLAEAFDLEMEVVPVLADMEDAGVGVDLEALYSTGVTLTEERGDYERRIKDIVAREINLNSPAQLSRYLYDELGLPVRGRTDTGEPSVDEETLKKIRSEHPVVEPILEYKKRQKALNLCSRLEKSIHPVTGRIHSELKQARVVTGRITTAKPNLQGVPKGPMRQVIIPRQEHVFIVADYSQIQLRILANYSDDSGLIEAFLEGEDIHTQTAAEIFTVRPQEVTADQRATAKVVNFGIIFGMGSDTLARELGTDRETADRYIRRFFDNHVRVRLFQEEQVRLARGCGYVRTFITGRKRRLADIDSVDYSKRMADERRAFNAAIQGTEAEILKRAMVRLSLVLQGHNARMLLPVHDEIIVEVGQGENLQEIQELIRRTMEEPPEGFRVPLVVNLEIKRSWGGEVVDPATWESEIYTSQTLAGPTH